MPGQQGQRGLRQVGEQEPVLAPVPEPGVVVARRPAHDELVDPGGPALVALVGKSGVLEPGTFAVEQIEPVGPPVEVAGDTGRAAAGKFDAPLRKTLFEDFLPPVPPAPGAGLVQSGDPGGERVQHTQQRRVGRGLRNQQRTNVPGMQEQISEAYLRRPGLTLHPCDGNPWLLDQIGHRRSHAPPPVVGLLQDGKRGLRRTVGVYVNCCTVRPCSPMQNRCVGLVCTHLPPSCFRFNRRMFFRAAVPRQVLLASPSTPSTSRFGTGMR